MSDARERAKRIEEDIASGPMLDLAVKAPRQLAHRGRIERSVVAPPPSYHRVVLLRQFGQRRRGLAGNAPAAHSLPHALLRVGTHTRQKTGEDPVLPTDGLPGPESKA